MTDKLIIALEGARKYIADGSTIKVDIKTMQSMIDIIKVLESAARSTLTPNSCAIWS